MKLRKKSDAIKPISKVLSQKEQESMTPDHVLKDLKEGNARFIIGEILNRDYIKQARISNKGQYPKAAILACSDSRVPVEIIFDQGIGDIFVCRVAGNMVNTYNLGSLEYAVAVTGSRLILVLGHTNCGAIISTIDRSNVEKMGYANLNALLRGINPSIKFVLEKHEHRDPNNADLIHRAVIENVKHTIKEIRKKSRILKQAEKSGKIKITGAVYDIETGMVNWL